MLCWMWCGYICFLMVIHWYKHWGSLFLIWNVKMTGSIRLLLACWGKRMVALLSGKKSVILIIIVLWGECRQSTFILLMFGGWLTWIWQNPVGLCSRAVLVSPHRCGLSTHSAWAWLCFQHALCTWRPLDQGKVLHLAVVFSHSAVKYSAAPWTLLSTYM